MNWKTYIVRLLLFTVTLMVGHDFVPHHHHHHGHKAHSHAESSSEGSFSHVHGVGQTGFVYTHELTARVSVEEQMAILPDWLGISFQGWSIELTTQKWSVHTCAKAPPKAFDCRLLRAPPVSFLC